MEEVAYLGQRIYRWQTGASTFLAWPERGARLMNWNLSYADGSFRDIVHWPTIDSVDEFAKARGGNPILFPFSARTFHQGTIHRWADPAGTVRSMPMHGLARQGRFAITHLDKLGFDARFEPDAEARESFPYDYDFEVVYRFGERDFMVELRLANLGKTPIPWSAGHHFYFTVPWVDDTSRQDYSLRLPAKKAARHLSDGQLAPIPISKKPWTIDDPALVDCIHYELTESIVRCDCATDDSKLEIEIGTSPTPNPGYAVVTWSESANAPFYCIEPWMGPPNSPEHKTGLHFVPPGETSRFAVSVRV